MSDMDVQHPLKPVPATEFSGRLPAGVEETDTVVPLDAYVPKLAAWRECDDQIKFWTKRQEKIKAELDEIMAGATVGTVDGEAALFHRPQERFAARDFQKAYPDLAKLYSREITKHQFDERWLRSVKPDLWSEFQVRSWRIAWEK